MPSVLLDSFASALRARAAAPADDAERRRAAISLADHLGCRAAASPIEPGPPWAVSPVDRAADAALAARQADRDDVHWASLTHPGSVVWPIVTELGAASGAAGPRRLASALTGYAAMAGLAAALGPDHAAVFHSTATAGAVAAAATAAVLLDLPDDRWPHALGHALSVLGGSRGALIESSGTRCFHSAHAIRTGLAATLAAARGIDATTADLDRRQGVLAGLDPDRLQVGDDRALAESSLRVFPTSGGNPTAYQAAQAAAQQVRGRVEAAERSGEVAVDLPLDHPSRPATLDQVATLKWHITPAEAADRVARIAAELAGEETA